MGLRTMIGDALEFIVKEIRELPGLSDSDVSLVGVSGLKEAHESSGVGVSLINVQEEPALRNTDHVVRNGSTVHYQQPAVYLNLFVLIWFDFSVYKTSLVHLSSVAELFQHKRFMSADNESAGNPFPASLDTLILDLQPLTFEQLNYVWGVAGSVYLPSLLYKVRLVRIQREETTEASVITTIRVETTVE